MAGITTLNNNLVVASGKTTKLGGTLTVTGVTALNNNLVVASGKTTTLGGTLGVSKAATFEDTVLIKKLLTAQGGVSATSLETTGAALIGGSLTANENLTVLKNVTLNSTSGSTNIYGPTFIDDTLTIGENYSIIPQITNKGSVGTSDKRWLNAYVNNVYTDKVTLSGATYMVYNTDDKCIEFILN